MSRNVTVYRIIGYCLEINTSKRWMAEQIHRETTESKYSRHGYKDKRNSMT